MSLKKLPPVIEKEDKKPEKGNMDFTLKYKEIDKKKKKRNYEKAWREEYYSLMMGR